MLKIKNKYQKLFSQKISRRGLTVFCCALAFVFTASLLVSFTIARAGSLSPSASPASTMYNLSDIYARLTTNATATEGNHSLSPSASPASTMHTLKEVYEAIPTILANTIKAGTSYLGIAGSLTPDGGTSTVADLFNGKTANLTDDWNLDTGALDLACNTATFDGTGNKVSDAYDGAGDGTNRWCMTDSGDAISSDILTGKTAWVNGVAVSGTGSAGYTYGDDTAAKVLVTATGAGTALANMYNGTNTTVTFPGGSPANGGVDDYNAGGAAPADRYVKGWTECVSENHYCGTNTAEAAYRDESTGLVWSKTMNSGTYALDGSNGSLTWFVANNCTESSGSVCTKKTSAQTGCEANAGWSLPHQKQLMQAYIDGSYGFLDLGVPRYYWSATTNSNNTTYAWYTTLSLGTTYTFNKTSTNSVRCVVFSLGN